RRKVSYGESPRLSIRERTLSQQTERGGIFGQNNQKSISKTKSLRDCLGGSSLEAARHCRGRGDSPVMCRDLRRSSGAGRQESATTDQYFEDPVDSIAHGRQPRLAFVEELLNSSL